MLENVVKRSEFGYTREQRYTKVICYYYYYYWSPSPTPLHHPHPIIICVQPLLTVLFTPGSLCECPVLYTICFWICTNFWICHKNNTIFQTAGRESVNQEEVVSLFFMFFIFYLLN